MTTSMLLQLFVITLTGFLRATGVQGQYWSSCRTPVQEPGSCVLVAECNFIRQVLQKPILDNNDIRYVEASRCGTYQKKALVCCAKPTGSPPGAVTQPALTNRADAEPLNVDRINLLPRAPVCGIQYSDRIVGGERTKIDEYPWTARIQHHDRRSNEYGFHCGGSLINELYVLTAAHCVVGIPKAWTVSGVRLGEWDTSTDPDCDDADSSDCFDPVQDIRVEKSIPHEDFISSRTEVHNDIALLRLAEKARYSDTVVPICLPIDASFASRSYDTRKMFVAGWGQTEAERGSRYKLFVAVSGVSMQHCQEQYPNAKIDDRQICAGGEAGKDSCKGDSGGPLMDVEYSKGQVVYYLAGVVSFGRQCGMRDVPGVYTNVHRFVNWVSNHIDP
ncbi:CLIP domain-containing serine protease B4-like [Malaya genurostris]|uniref:CLIP domain-containing serine protease B4-like n=1 Tax=Malaya genurostris TaxID=325434 RepID=UPI0026F3EEC7|nr:CLIP domain-containing serine protease B4-like [Malaya genurostris]